MRYVHLNGTDLSVSPICLGTVNYGTAMSATDSKKQLSQFVEAGGNFVDTAHVYGDWEPEILCRSERVIGEWIKETGNREQIILATKGAHPVFQIMNIPRVTPEEITKDLNESLKYLNTDYVDIYFLHRDDENVPVSEIMDCLDEAQKQGKIRYYGCSNWSLKRIKEAAEYCNKKGIKGFVVNQLMWSLADINFDNLSDKTFILMDEDTYKYHENTGMNVMAYMSIAKGYFTRKSEGEILPDSIEAIYGNASNRIIYERLMQIAKESNYSIMDISLMYLMAHKFPSAPIASYDNFKQMNQAILCLQKPIPQDIISELSSIKKFVYRNK